MTDVTKDAAALTTDHPAGPTLAERMKGYEAELRPVLPPRSYALLRVDGKSFSSYTRGLARPYDEVLMRDMDAVAEALVGEVSGAVCAFTQSDEVSVLFTDLSGPRTQMHLGGSVNKLVSLSAALATATFNARRPGRLALFDARVFVVPSRAEAANCLLWRQRDATRNAVAMSAQARYSHKALQRVGVAQMLAMLERDGVDFDAYPAGFRLGRLTTRVEEPGTVEYVDGRTGATRSAAVVRSVWRTAPAPVLSADLDGLLVSMIPTADALAPVAP